MAAKIINKVVNALKPAEMSQKAAADKEIELTPNEYVAYAMLRKKGSGGRWVMRTLKIKDGKIIDQTDSVENLAGVLLGEITYQLEKDV